MSEPEIDITELKKSIETLELVLTQASRHMSAMLRAVNTKNAFEAFNNAASAGAEKQLNDYVDCILVIRHLINTSFKTGKITASGAQTIYKHGKKELSRLNLKYNQHRRQSNKAKQPPQDGTRNSVRTVSGGLPSLGRNRKN